MKRLCVALCCNNKSKTSVYLHQQETLEHSALFSFTVFFFCAACPDCKNTCDFLPSFLPFFAGCAPTKSIGEAWERRLQKMILLLLQVPGTQRGRGRRGGGEAGGTVAKHSLIFLKGHGCKRHPDEPDTWCNAAFSIGSTRRLAQLWINGEAVDVRRENWAETLATAKGAEPKIAL